MKNKILNLITIAAVAFAGYRMLGTSHADSTEVAKKIAAGAVIVDVRTPEEFATGAYPNAINIPVQVIEQRMNELPRNKPIVVYCRSGRRSAMAKEILDKAGFTDVTNGGGLTDMPKPQ